MKRIFTSAAIAIVMLLAATSAQAQIKFGLKGGLNVTDMSLSRKVFDADNQAGFFIGPTVKFTLPVMGLGIDAAALYDQRQAKVKGEVGYEQIYIEERSLDSKYINIPSTYAMASDWVRLPASTFLQVRSSDSMWAESTRNLPTRRHGILSHLHSVLM